MPPAATTTVSICLLLLTALAACAPDQPRDLVRKEKEAGHHWQQCDLARQSVRADRSLLAALGECYEHGWGALARDQDAAIDYYEQAARWGNPEAIAALRRLGAEVPETDLLHEEHRHLDERRAAELKHAVLLAIIGTEQGIARHPDVKPVGGPLDDASRANIADSPAFSAFLKQRRSKGLPPACADVYIENRKVDSWGPCK